jgi:membrane-associated phospholipid phosphatase
VTLSFASLGVLAVVLFTYREWDVAAAHYFYARREGFLNAFFSVAHHLGRAELYLVPALLLWLLKRKRRPPSAKRALFVFASVAAAGLTADLFKVVLARRRPRLYLFEGLHGFDFWRLDASHLSFPSGHTATLFAAAASIALLAPRWRVPAFAVAALIGFGRIATLDHYPSDVIAGAWVGVLGAWACWRAFGLAHAWERRHD